MKNAHEHFGELCGVLYPFENAPKECQDLIVLQKGMLYEIYRAGQSFSLKKKIVEEAFAILLKENRFFHLPFSSFGIVLSS